MDSNILNKSSFYFVCTNYGSSKDGIGHYTSRLVSELKKNDLYEVRMFSGKTDNLSKLKLILSLNVSLNLLKLRKELKRNSSPIYVVLEYPFLEYNPLFILILGFIRLNKKQNDKIIVSLHEYKRTKFFRKLFTKLLIPFSDIVLFTKEEDIETFREKKITFKKRVIPSNIVPRIRTKTEINKPLNICFFGTINFRTKEINNMIKGWEVYCQEFLSNQQVKFHFISSTFNEEIKKNSFLTYHYDLNDDRVSVLLNQMHFMILPLRPKISINNGSLSVGCVHGCIPVGFFDNRYFDSDFGLSMKDYSLAEFIKIYKLIANMDVGKLENKLNLAYQYGKTKSIKNTVNSYLSLIE